MTRNPVIISKPKTGSISLVNYNRIYFFYHLPPKHCITVTSIPEKINSCICLMCTLVTRNNTNTLAGRQRERYTIVQDMVELYGQPRTSTTIQEPLGQHAPCIASQVVLS